MNSEKKSPDKLPDGWVLCKSKSVPGRKYYFNKKTGKSSWSQPQVNLVDNVDEKKEHKEKLKKLNKGKEEKKKRNVHDESQIVSDLKKTTQESSTPEKKHITEASENSKRKLNPKLIGTLNKKKNDTYCKERKKHLSSNHNTKPLTKNFANTRLQKLRATLALELHKEDLKTDVQIKKTSKQGLNNTFPIAETRINNSTIASTKNTANSSVIQLRSSLISDVHEGKHSESDLSPLKKIKKSSHPDTGCSVSSKSPANDNLHSTASSSQFFAANRILSSMKAQLTEEFMCKDKQKDTFADIEKGICDQTPEYPPTKHPSTPPQFSEASKLVSAIKLRLSYNSKDVNRVITNKAYDSLNESEKITEEAMDIDDKELKQNEPCRSNDFKENVVLVVDTNLFIHELDVIKNVLNSHIKGYSEQPTLLVPWRVINELDRLKDVNNGVGAICKRARTAMNYLYKLLPENKSIKGQSLRDASSHIYPCEVPDDEILNCCLQQKDKGNSVILLSNDKNLCNKALINNVKCIEIQELNKLLVKKTSPTTVCDQDLKTSIERYQNVIFQLLSNILESEMKANYNDLWQHVIFKAPPWTLGDVLQCLLKHWIAVFNDVFPRIKHLIADLQHILISIEFKDLKSLSQSEVSNFKELCIEIAKKCQIIPEYMELAKATVDNLERGECPNDAPNISKVEQHADLVVIDAFEQLWTVFSSYCAKLLTGLGVAHSLEDQLTTNDGFDVLTSKLHLFSTQIKILTTAINKVVSEMGVGNAVMGDCIKQLETIFKESLAVLGMDTSNINENNFNMFCRQCGNMLQEASTKFTHLVEMLEICKNKLFNNEN